MAKTSLPHNAAARRERAVDGNHLGGDAVLSGMAAAGLGLALLHQDIEAAKASVGDDRRIDLAPGAAPESHVPVSQGEHHQSAADDMADPHREHAVGASAAAGAEHSPHADNAQAPLTSTFTHDGGPAGESRPDDPWPTSETATAPAGHSSGAVSNTSDSGQGLHDAVPNVSSALSGMTAGLQDIGHVTGHVTDQVTASLAHSVDAVANGIGDALASLTSQLSPINLLQGHGGLAEGGLPSFNHATDALAGIPSALLGASPAVPQMDPIFHGIFGTPGQSPASHVASDVVDTGGLAALGDVGHPIDLGFLGQSYTELADHSLAGVPGIAHGLI